MRKRNAMLFGVAVLCIFLTTPAWSNVVYTNGPINGTLNGYTIANSVSFPNNWAVSDSFTPSSGATLTQAWAGLWVQTAEIPLSVSWSIGTSAFGSDISSGTSNLSNVFNNASGSGYDVYKSFFSISGTVAAGSTYYLTLSYAINNGSNSYPDTVFWDENNGPSTAFQKDLGGGQPFSVGSESFAVGNPVPIPGALLLFGPGFAGLAVIRGKFKI